MKRLEEIHNDENVLTEDDRPGNGTVTIRQGGVAKGVFGLDGANPVTIDLDAGGSDSFFVHVNIGQFGNAKKASLTLTTGGKAYVFKIADSTNNKLVINNREVSPTDTNYPLPVYSIMLRCSSPVEVSGSVDEYGSFTIMDADFNPVSTTTLTSDSHIFIFGGQACLSADTLIAMADGTARRIDEVRVGDRVLAVNPYTLEKDVDAVLMSDADSEKYGDVTDVWTFDDGTVLKTVNPHEFYNVRLGRMEYIGKFEMGDKVRRLDGTEAALVSHESVDGRVRHCTIFTNKYNNYFANGVLTGNRRSAKWGRHSPENEKPPPRTFSKLKVVSALTEMGVWPQVEAWMTNQGVMHLYQAAQVLSEADPYFRQGLTALQTALKLTDEQVESILRNCIAD